MPLPNMTFGSGTSYTPQPGLLFDNRGIEALTAKRPTEYRIVNPTPGSGVGSLNQVLPSNWQNGTMIAGFSLPMPTPEYLLQQLASGREQAFNAVMSALKMVADVSKPAAQELVKKLVELAGGAQGLMNVLKGLGARAVSAFIAFVQGITLTQLAAALLIAAVALGILAEPMADATIRPQPQPLPKPQRLPNPTPYNPPTTHTTDYADVSWGDITPSLDQTQIGQSQIALSNTGNTGTDDANAWMDKTTAKLMPLNNAIQQFYWAASGGATARRNGSVSEAIAQVQSLRNDLAYINSQSNAPIASIQSAAQSLEQIMRNPANAGQLFPDLGQAINQFRANYTNLNEMRNAYKALVQSLDLWLAQAHKHAADGTQPLPALPPTIWTPSNVDPNTVVSGLEKAQAAAQASLDASARAQQQQQQPTTLPPQVLPPTSVAPSIPAQPAPARPATTATTPIAGAQPTMPTTAPAATSIGWLNPAAGTIAPQRASAQDVQVQLNVVAELAGRGQRVTMNVEGEPIEGEIVWPEPIAPPGSGAGDQAQQRPIEVNITGHFYQSPQDKPPNWKDKLGDAVKVVVISLLASSPFAAQGIYGQHRADEQARQLSTDFSAAKANAQELLAGLSANSTDDQIRHARQEIWRGYLSAATNTLANAEWNKVMNLGWPTSIYSRKEIQDLTSDWEGWLRTQYSTTMPTEEGAQPDRYAYEQAARLGGDTNRYRHMREAFENASFFAQEQVNRIPGATKGLGEVAPKDIAALVAKHKPALTQSDPAQRDEARRLAYVEIYRHYLSQVPSAPGAGRASLEERELYTKQLEAWLSERGAGALNLDNFRPSLALREPFRSQLGQNKGDAVLAVERFNQLLPRLSLAERVGLPPSGKPDISPALPGPATGAPDAVPVTPQPPQRPQQPLPVTPTAPTQARLQAERERALNSLERVLQQHVNEGKLFQPPSTASFDTLRFTPEMFFRPGQPRTAEAIEAAIANALALYRQIQSIGNAIQATRTPSAIEVGQKNLVPLLNDFNSKVLNALYATQPEQPAAQPSPTATPTPTPTSGASPVPTGVPATP